MTAVAKLSQRASSYPYKNTSRLYLENTTAGHRKFYEMINMRSGGWLARYGKIGTKGQTSNYAAGHWYDKLSEKLMKGYVLLEVITAVQTSTPPPVVQTVSKKKDPDILADPVIMEKLSRIELFLETKDVNQVEKVVEIKMSYVRTGVLTKGEMQELNKLWIAYGGGKW